MAYGTPQRNPEYNPSSKEEYDPYKYQRDRRNKKPLRETEKTNRVISGIKSIGRGTFREAHGFAKEIRREGVISAYKTERTLQRENRQLRRAARQPRTRIRQYRPVTPSYAGLGERAVAEASSGWIPHLDRDYFGQTGEPRDLIGTGARDMGELINTAESNLKKKEQRYY